MASERFGRRWEIEREAREIRELEDFARLLMVLFGEVRGTVRTTRL